MSVLAGNLEVSPLRRRSQKSINQSIESKFLGLSLSNASLVIVIFTLNIRRSIPFVREMTAFVENQIVVALRFGLDSLANTIPAIQA